MATTFHPFPLLPWELRDKIWKLAIRPAVPGAHVFRVYNAKDSERFGPEHETSCDNYPCISKSRLAAPRCLPRGVGFSPNVQAAAPISWTRNNPSSYLIDSGLWAACKESLLVIEKEFQSRARRQWSPSEMESFRKKRGRFTLPELATFFALDGFTRRPLSIFPDQDLFILQTHDIAALDWDFTRDSIPSYTLATCDWIQYADGERHMALDYDPVWDKAGHDCWPRRDWEFIGDIVENTARAEERFYLWFIDYRIKRNPRYQDQGPAGERAGGLGHEAPRVFYASDRRFVEVKKQQLGYWSGHDRLWDGGYEVPADDLCPCCGADEFVQHLEYEMDGKWDHDKRDWHGLDSYSWNDYGLLACEYL
ncbi:hypothetical protein QBC46DRAFT_416538 [Diplogelasinospora grovesii]|uniref:2EXR domain-containing protein n=1 Tax=Diplogelasinospora grovesii TaxID=303347 RepID=A0AAN6S1R9_9PEZI|nr:hypothetical protein QBC46DRAFT_416538 [Diplogelasinospora grovesii]